MNTIRRNVTAFALVLTLGTAGAAVAAQTTTGFCPVTRYESPDASAGPRAYEP